jgi:hypothetical protein
MFRYTTERRCPAVLCKGENSYAAEEDDSVELSDVESWDSLHELHAPALARGARVYPPSIAINNARASNRPEGGKVRPPPQHFDNVHLALGRKRVN